jgi:cytochrome P450
MVRATREEASNPSKQDPESLEQGSAKGNASMGFAEVMGNAFLFVLAGHETSGNTVHFALVYLAVYPASQARLQEDLDAIFGDRPDSEWSYEEDFPKLQDSLVAAFMYETLRLKTPVAEIVKIVGAEPQPLTIDGRTVMIPPKTIIASNVIASHLNARNWPTSSSEEDLEEFRAERWLVDNLASPSSSAPPTTTGSGEDEHAPTRQQQQQQQQQHGHSGPHAIYRPRRGAFIPFSEGARACLGRRFATVEILAALALILRDYSVELAVHEYATDDEVERMPAGSAARRAVWDKAHARAQWLLTEGMGMRITLQMVKGRVPIRVVKRGRERFRFSD